MFYFQSQEQARLHRRMRTWYALGDLLQPSFRVRVIRQCVCKRKIQTVQVKHFWLTTPFQNTVAALLSGDILLAIEHSRKLKTCQCMFLQLQASIKRQSVAVTTDTVCVSLRLTLALTTPLGSFAEYGPATDVYLAVRAPRHTLVKCADAHISLSRPHGAAQKHRLHATIRQHALTSPWGISLFFCVFMHMSENTHLPLR